MVKLQILTEMTPVTQMGSCHHGSLNVGEKGSKSDVTEEGWSQRCHFSDLEDERRLKLLF